MRGTVYVQEATSQRVLILSETPSEVSIADITGTGTLSNQRSVSKDTFADEYVPERQTISAEDENVDEGNLQNLNDRDLLALAHKYLVQAAHFSRLAEKAKEELRRREPRKGVTVIGDIALEAIPASRFNADLAKAKLTNKQLAEISVSKPDAEKARQKFGANSDLYRSLCKEGKTRLEIRTATPKDRGEAYGDTNTESPH